MPLILALPRDLVYRLPQKMVRKGVLQGALEWESWSSESAPVATGASLEEAEACIHEAIDFHLDGLRQDGMPIPLLSSHVEYLELVDWAGRAIRADKRGAIPSHIPPILNRLGLDPGRYLHHMGGKSKLTQHITAIGPLVGNWSRRCSRSLAPGAIYRLHPCNRTSGIHAVDRLQALAK